MTDYHLLSNLLCDCFSCFRDFLDFRVGDDEEVIYRLLCLAQDICDKNVEK